MAELQRNTEEFQELSNVKYYPQLSLPMRFLNISFICHLAVVWGFSFGWQKEAKTCFSILTWTFEFSSS